MNKSPYVALLLAFAVVCPFAQAQTIRLAPSHSNGVYAIGEQVIWNVTVEGGDPNTVAGSHYKVSLGGGKILAQGDLDLSKGVAQIVYNADQAVSYLAEVTATIDGKLTKSYGGAVAAPDRVTPSMPRPADFDAFWASKIAELRAVAPDPVVERGDSGVQGVVYETVTLANVGGARIHAQIAYPENGKHLPAEITLQWAGVYALPKTNVTNLARQGWFAVDVMAHDLPLNMPADFYVNAGNTTLKNYPAFGKDDRNTSYFLKMVLGDVRVADYVRTRPEWDGKTLVALGTSQGGFQTIALAGLYPQITEAMALVPACCDQTATLVGRGPCWPNWLGRQTDTNASALKEACRYYDSVNFAAKIHVPTLVGIGLIDVTSTPTGDLAMANQLAGPKEVVLLPLSNHHGDGNTQAAYNVRLNEWLNAIKAGRQPDVRGAN
ncbi:MAG: acetylxylan esterase [Capsulimonadaceae bacterium]|nr:acetylxylan esterase [Capsulimonadaceae bacterium]